MTCEDTCSDNCMADDLGDLDIAIHARMLEKASSVGCQKATVFQGLPRRTFQGLLLRCSCDAGDLSDLFTPSHTCNHASGQARNFPLNRMVGHMPHKYYADPCQT